MNKQLSLLVVVGILVLGVGIALYLAQPDGSSVKDYYQKDGGESVLAAEITSHDFGAISMKEGKVKTVFKVSNPTEEDVQLEKMYTSCMCTEAKIRISGRQYGPFSMPGHGSLPTFKASLAPGDEAEVEVEYDPAAHGPSGIGISERIILIDGPKGRLIFLTIRANVTP
jgi:hypothetical protein